MTFWQFFQNNMTKILGMVAAMLGALQVLLAGGAFNELLDKKTLGWLGIVVGLLTAAVGFNNSSKEKVATAMQDAINATPPKQGGYVRASMLAVLLAIAVPLVSVLPGCQTFSGPSASTFNARLLQSYRTVEGVVETANLLAQQGKLSKKDTQNIYAQAQNAKVALDVASALHDDSPALGEDKLATTLAILEALQSYLAGVK